jgi:hypothetical protein
MKPMDMLVEMLYSLKYERYYEKRLRKKKHERWLLGVFEERNSE